jgi:hypothetical protein
MTTPLDPELDEIARYLMRPMVPNEVDILRLFIYMTAGRILREPDWLLGASDRDQRLMENVLVLATGPNDGARH